MGDNLFQGNIPSNYEEYLGPLLFEAYAIDMKRRLNPAQGRSILELSCGTGRLTKHLLNVLTPDGLLLATDINPAMLEVAKQKVRADDRLSWECADAIALPYEAGKFDSVVGQFGVMFYKNKPKSYQEVFRVLKKGGVYIFNTWNSMANNPIIEEVTVALDDYFGNDAPDFYNVPFSYYDPKDIKSDMAESGFSKIDISVVKVNGFSDTAANAAKGLLQGTPVYSGIIERNKDVLPDLMVALEERLTKKYGASNLIVPLEALVITAS